MVASCSTTVLYRYSLCGARSLADHMKTRPIYKLEAWQS